jgi:hypothetical protein
MIVFIFQEKNTIFLARRTQKLVLKYYDCQREGGESQKRKNQKCGLQVLFIHIADWALSHTFAKKTQSNSVKYERYKLSPDVLGMKQFAVQDKPW